MGALDWPLLAVACPCELVPDLVPPSLVDPRSLSRAVVAIMASAPAPSAPFLLPLVFGNCAAYLSCGIITSQVSTAGSSTMAAAPDRARAHPPFSCLSPHVCTLAVHVVLGRLSRQGAAYVQRHGKDSKYLKISIYLILALNLILLVVGLSRETKVVGTHFGDVRLPRTRELVKRALIFVLFFPSSSNT